MFDFKKEFKQFYAPKQTPQILTIPPANFVCIRGDGDPNESGGAYQARDRGALRRELRAKNELQNRL